MHEGKENRILGPFFLYLYGISGGSIRVLIIKIVLKIEGGPLLSTTIRKIFSKYHKVDIGYYSDVSFNMTSAFQENTTIGRYTSIYHTVRAFSGNHPMNTKSTHGLFYNLALGYAKHDFLNRTQLRIGNDVFLGHNAIITAAVSEIGDGAVIGAGTLVNRNIPPYAIVVGIPGRIIRYRFNEDKITELLESKWWEKTIDELLPEFDEFTKPLDGSEFIY